MNNIISQNQEKIKNTQRYIPHLLEPRFMLLKLTETVIPLVMFVDVIRFLKPLLCIGIKNLMVPSIL